MKRTAVLLCAILVMMLLAGCAGKKKTAQQEVVLPEEITQRDIDRLESLTSQFPTRYAFPGQVALPPVLGIFFNGTLAQGTGSTGAEVPNDDGPLDYGGTIIPFDLADKVPVGQPAEVRIGLKWWGDPGTSADLDIWVDMPGTQDAFNAKRYDESMNFNIINKARVANAVHLDGQPFQVGIQVNNGKILHPDGVDYSLRVDLFFADGVLAPGAPYAIQVPPNATGLIINSDRIMGDEHVDSSFAIVGPDDKLLRYMHHNDIGVDTLFIPVKQPGEHIVYAHSMHGGFLRIESETPNPDFQARRLETTVTDLVLFAGPQPAPGTYAEQGTSGNTWGEEGSFEVGPAFPLDVTPTITAESGTVDAAINVTTAKGWLATAFMRGSYRDDNGRVGPHPGLRAERASLDVGTYTFGVVSNGPGVTLGVKVLGYVR